MVVVGVRGAVEFAVVYNNRVVMMNLYELTEEWRCLLETASAEADETTGEIAADIAAQIEAVEAKREDKVDAIIRMIRNVNADAMGYQIEIKRLAAKSAACDRVIENMRQWLALNMQAKETIKTSIASISCRETESIEITGAVPEDRAWGTFKFSPSKTSIRTAIEAGAVVPFAAIVKSRSVVIR